MYIVEEKRDVEVDLVPAAILLNLSNSQSPLMLLITVRLSVNMRVTLM